MKIIYAGKMSKVFDCILEREGSIAMIDVDTSLTASMVMGYDLLVSYGYRKKVNADILDILPCINLHISYLPYNRGCDPNYWSFRDNTPKGATVHYMSKEFDTGDIIVRDEFNLVGNTLKETYNELSSLAEEMFVSNYDYIKSLPTGHPQEAGGSYHYKHEMPNLRDGYDTLVGSIAQA